MGAEVHHCKTYPSLLVTQQGFQLAVGESAGSNKYLCAATLYHLESGLSFQWLEISCVIPLGGVVCDSDEQRHGAHQQPACLQSCSCSGWGAEHSQVLPCWGSVLLHCCSPKQSVGTSACVSVWWGCQSRLDAWLGAAGSESVPGGAGGQA